MAEDPNFQPNRRFKLDMFNVVIGIIGQTCLTLLPMYIVLSMKLPLVIVIIVLIIVGLILKKTWWNKLEEDEPSEEIQPDKKLADTIMQ